MEVMQTELSHLALGTVRQLLRQRGIFSRKGRDIWLDAFYSVLGLYESVWAAKIVITKVWQLLDLLDPLRLADLPSSTQGLFTFDSGSFGLLPWQKDEIKDNKTPADPGIPAGFMWVKKTQGAGTEDKNLTGEESEHSLRIIWKNNLFSKAYLI